MTPRLFPLAEKLARFTMNSHGMASRTVTAAGLRLHVYDGTGQGTLPPVVIVHGLGSAGAAFGAVASRLRPHVRRVVIPELPGHGFSERGPRPITPEILLEAIDVAIGNVLGEPAIVYGNSLGGALAIKYALARPERVKALALVSPAGALLPDEDWRALVAAFDVTTPGEARAFLEKLYHRPPWFLGVVARAFPDMLARPAIHEILANATQEHAPTAEELGSLAMPILFLWGRSEKLLPPAALAYFRAHLPAHAVIEQPYGFGHTPQLEVPGAVAQRLLRFIRDITVSEEARSR